MSIDHHSVDAECNIVQLRHKLSVTLVVAAGSRRFTASVGRRRRGVPDDVLLKVRVVVRRLSAKDAS